MPLVYTTSNGWNLTLPDTLKKKARQRSRHKTVDPIIALQQQLFSSGYVTADRQLLARVHELMEQSQMTRGPVAALLLQGPPGTGKTFLAETIQSLWEAQQFLSFQFTQGVTKEDLMYDLDIANIAAAQAGKWQGEFSARDAVSPGIFAQALLSSLKQRTVLLLDELDKASEKVDAFLLEYLQGATMHAGPLGRLKGNPKNLLVFVTMNNQRLITEPLMRRCLRVELTWPSPEVEMRLVRMLASKQLAERGKPSRVNVKQLSQNVVRLANEVRGFGKQLKKVPSTPELARAVVSCAVLPKQDWGHAVESALLAYEGDRQVAVSLWGKSAEQIKKELETPLVKPPLTPKQLAF
jgi:MoxR-like ATPase